MDHYANWRKRLAGEEVKTFLQAQPDDCGYYRIPLTEPELGANGKTNGRKRVIGWTPVALFPDPFVKDTLRGIIGDRDMRDDEVSGEQVWSYCCRNPINYDTYQAVAERGEPWPDLPAQDIGSLYAAASGHPQPRIVSDNAALPTEAPKVMTLEDHRAAIDAAVKAADKVKVHSLEEANVAAGTMNRLAELRLAADKAGKAIYEPLYREYKSVQSVWSPLVTRASTAEKALDVEIRRWKQAEYRRIEDEKREFERKRREEEEANARAADRAIARGEPEPQPAVTVEPPPESSVAPAPVVATHGTRKFKEPEQSWHLDSVENFDDLYLYFKSAPALQALLRTLAAAAIKAGRDVPGTTKHFGVI